MDNDSERLEWSPRLLTLEAELSGDLPDDPDAIHRVAKAIRKNVAGIRRPSDPLGRFLLIGPNEKARRLAVALARTVFGNGRRVFSLDIQDYSEKHQVADLIGRVGGLACDYFDGQLSEPLRLHPQTIVVLEGIDKAHRGVSTLLLESFESGSLFDPMGDVSLKKVVFIFTTAMGYVKRPERPDCLSRVGGNSSAIPVETMDAVTSVFPPEMLRGTFIDDILLVS